MGEEVWILLFLGERNFKWDFPADRDRWESVSFSFIIMMTMAMALIDDYNDDCRYDQSTAEAFRAVQKSGEMVMIIVLYHFISCNPFFGVTSKSKVSILIPWRHPSNPRIPSNAPRYPPKPLQTSPWKVHTTILLRPPCRLWNPPKALITSPWIKSKISPTTPWKNQTQMCRSSESLTRASSSGWQVRRLPRLTSTQMWVCICICICICICT